MAVDSFSHSSSDVLNDIDPLSRALLDLSVQRGMDDAEIASVLGTDTESVFEVRVGLLRSLADKVAPEHADADVAELQAVIAERLYADPQAAAPAPATTDDPAIEHEAGAHEASVGEDEPVQGPDAAAEEPAIDIDGPASYDEPEPRDDRPTAVHAVQAAPNPPVIQPAGTRRRRSPLVYLIPLLLLAAVGAGIVALVAADDGGESDAPAAEQPAAAPAPERPSDARDGGSEGSRAARLAPVGGTDARGTARIEGGRLKLNLRGLPAAQGGAYEVWLYDSIIDAKSLGTTKGANARLDARLPAGADDYEWVDVSVEPADGNPNHSGESVLRVPLEKLR